MHTLVALISYLIQKQPSKCAALKKIIVKKDEKSKVAVKK